MSFKGRKLRIVYYVLLLILDIADLVSDWMLWAEVDEAEKGLVYGPPDESVVTALLAFCIVGSFSFLVEDLNLISGIFRKEGPFLDMDRVTTVTIWVEDLPQIVINVVIARCREDPISVFQLSKASICLISLFIRLALPVGKYACERCRRRHRRDYDEDGKANKVCFGFTVAGLLINSGCAIAVFIFTQTWPHPDTGQPVLQVPTTLFEDSYNDQRYFQNVSVFVHLPEFDAGPSLNPYDGSKGNWVRLMPINEIRNTDANIHYKYTYEKSATWLRMALRKKTDYPERGDSGAWELRECCELDLTNGNLAMVNVTVCQNPAFFTSPHQVYIGFSFVKPGLIIKKFIFGNIAYNIRTESGGGCVDYDNITHNVDKARSVPVIHYYRANATLSVDNTHMLVENGNPRFFRNDGSDLGDVRELWKTGWGGCESSGSMGPTLKRDVKTGCDSPTF